MSSLYHMTRVSGNAKTGPIPVTTSTAKTCPASCPFRGNGCYAEYGPLAMHWRKVTAGERGDNWPAFLSLVRKLPKGQPWRHNQAGDLPGDGDTIDAEMLANLARANTGKRGWTYTHKPLDVGANRQAIKSANDAGFCVNVSCETEAQVDAAMVDGLPAVLVVPAGEPRKNWHTQAGRSIVVCPATYDDTVDCARCQLCAVIDRKSAVAFPAHGTGKGKAMRTLEE